MRKPYLDTQNLNLNYAKCLCELGECPISQTRKTQDVRLEVLKRRQCLLADESGVVKAELDGWPVERKIERMRLT